MVQGLEGEGGTLQYDLGSLEDHGLLTAELIDIDTVLSSANGIIPSGKTMSAKAMAAGGCEGFISAAQEAAVRNWAQSSVPSYAGDASVPELAEKRLIEDRLERSPMAAMIIRNPAFIDVWLVMSDAIQATADHPHATTKRPYGFIKM